MDSEDKISFIKISFLLVIVFWGAFEQAGGSFHYFKGWNLKFQFLIHL